MKNMVDEEIEEIKRHTEEHYRVELPEVDIKYTYNSFDSYLIPPVKFLEEELYRKFGEGLGEIWSYLDFKTKNQLCERKVKDYLTQQEKKLGIKINPEKYTMVLPTPTAIRLLCYHEYLICEEREDELERLKGEESELEEVRTLKNSYWFLCNHPELCAYEYKWHEMGHLLARSKNLFGDLSEGIAMLYEFKGLLSGAREGKFKIGEVKEMIEHSRRNYKASEKYSRAFELVLGDFNPNFKSLEGAIQDIERRIVNTLKERENI